jgi:probable HAF family extracellular repeat protein
MDMRIVDLGTLGTGTISFAYNVSTNGNVVVGSSTTVGASTLRAFKWQNGAMIQLAGLTGGTQTEARGVSSDGSIIAGYSSISGVPKGWRFANNIYTSIGNLGYVTGYSYVYDMSSDGNVIVGESRNAGALFRGFVWNNGIMTDIGAITGGYTSSIAFGVDPTGTYAVGYSYGGGQPQKAIVWSSAVGILALPYPVMLISFSRAYSISSNGIIVGIAAFSMTELGTAFSYKNGVYTKLGLLPGFSFSLASDINADGSVIVGYSYNTSNSQPIGSFTSVSAFRYTNGVMTNIGDLGTYITLTDIINARTTGRDGGDDDLTLSAQAFTVSSDGNNIAGTSQVRMPNLSIEQHAFLYKISLKRALLSYYDQNRIYVAEAQDNQKKFPDASGYTQFLKGRAYGKMTKYQG